ncbi:hypothetical protein [Virgisporangium aurantiacum]|uniref:hypothetical protein n=1 Tax=Virgisporangium aurantiacum TaxID=175570 RepID=UPI00194EABDF|nr:hypothetical protein [Virgisporangium aurantiacum]
MPRQAPARPGPGLLDAVLDTLLGHVPLRLTNRFGPVNGDNSLVQRHAGSAT